MLLAGNPSSIDQRGRRRVTSLNVSLLTGPGISDIRRSFVTRFHSVSSTLDLIHMRNQERTYCQALEAVCNSIGVQDSRSGCSTADLAQHVQQIFGVDPDTHRRCLHAVQDNKPSNVCLCITVEKARDLKSQNANAECDPCCAVSIKSTARSITPKSSPQVSPKAQRRASACQSVQVTRRHSSIRPDIQTDRLTHTVKGTANPCWNTEFEIPVSDQNNDELTVQIWDDSYNSTDTDSLCRQNTPPRRNFRKYLTKKLSRDKQDGFLGQFKIALKDIPVLGSDEWYSLFEDGKNRHPTGGQCQLKLQLTARPSCESAESDQCSSEDYFLVCQRVYQHAFETMRTQSTKDGDPVFTELSQKSRMVLDLFAAQNHFTVMSQHIIELSALLEGFCDARWHPCHISEDAITCRLKNANDLWEKQQKQSRCNEIQGVTSQKELYSKTEVSLLEQIAIVYLDQTTDHLCENNKFPRTFPPIEISITELKQVLGFSKQLLAFLHKVDSNSIRNKLTDVVRSRIESDCENWWALKLNSIKSTDMDAVICEAKIFTGIVSECIDHCSPSTEVSQYFLEFLVNYEKTVIVCLDKKISNKAQEVILRIDSYQKKFLRYISNIMSSSRVSQSLYGELRRLVTVIRSHFTMRDLYRITMTSYQNWFKQSVTCWLQTFREEGIRRVVKALDIEKDVVQVTEGVKISNSAVDVVSNLHKICMEWKEIDFADADIALLAATKITELICDGITRYLEKIEHILENNGYYDFIDNSQFDVTDQLCITLNNIVHVIRFIETLPELLEWNKVCQNMTVKYEDESVGSRCQSTLIRLSRTTREELIVRTKALLTRVMNLMEKDLETYIMKISRCCHNTLSSVDALLDYLKTNLAVFHKKLDQFLVPSVVEGLWNKTIVLFSANLAEGQKIEYYEAMHKHLDSLYGYFDEAGLSSTAPESELFVQLVNNLKLHNATTEDLMLQYYSSLTNTTESPACFYGYLEIRVAYRLESSSIDLPVDSDSSADEASNRDQIAILFVNVLRAKSLPRMGDKEEACNAFVSISLCPTSLFTFNVNLKTPTVKASNNPVFDVTYQYQRIPMTQMKREGATLMMTVWNNENFLPCYHYLAEIAVPLNSIPLLNPLQCIEDIPTVIFPLKRMQVPNHGPFKVLSERQGWDRDARDMVAQRKRGTCMTTAWPLCRPMNFILLKFRGGEKNKVKGRPKLSAPML